MSDRETEVRLEFEIRPKEFAKRFVLLVLVIVIVGAIANVVIYNIAPTPEHALAKLMKRFDLGHEPSIPNWYSSLALLASSALLGIIALARKQGDFPHVSRWSALSVLFLLLAIDEAVLIHEMADAPLHDWLDSGGIFYFAWVIPGAVFTLGVVMFFFRFLLHLEARTRWLFMVGGAMFVGGAIGMELIEGVITDKYGIEGGFVSLRLTVAQTIEEALEMLGIVVFIYALLDYIERHVDHIGITFNKNF